MAITIKHAFTSLKGDGLDATQVQPSNWNAAHATSMATLNLIGRLTAGAGAFEEIPISAYMASLLATADAATLAGVLGLFETGDVKYTFKTTAATGWLLVAAAGSIGNATSGATLRASADCLALYTVIWNGCANTLAPVAGGRGASAVADFNAAKPMTIPALVGRSPMAAGSAATGTSARILGTALGEEAHVQLETEMAPHHHGLGITDPGHNHALSGTAASNPLANLSGGGGVGAGGAFGIPGGLAIGPAITNIRVISGNGLDTTDTRGGGQAFNVTHASIVLNVMVKL